MGDRARPRRLALRQGRESQGGGATVQVRSATGLHRDLRDGRRHDARRRQGRSQAHGRPRRHRHGHEADAGLPRPAPESRSWRQDLQAPHKGGLLGRRHTPVGKRAGRLHGLLEQGDRGNEGFPPDLHKGESRRILHRQNRLLPCETDAQQAAAGRLRIPVLPQGGAAGAAPRGTLPSRGGHQDHQGALAPQILRRERLHTHGDGNPRHRPAPAQGGV